MNVLRHCTAAVLTATIVPAAVFAQADPEPGTASFLVFVQNRQVGQEQVTLSRSSGEWTLAGNGRLGAPFDLVTEEFTVRYASDWQPIEMRLSTMLRGQPARITTSFGLTTAINEILQNGQTSTKTDEMPARTVVLAGTFFGSYEVLAARLPGRSADAPIYAYLPPQGTVPVQVRSVDEQRLERPQGTITLTRYQLTLHIPNAPREVTIWVDGHSRLARLEVPSLSLVLVRTDVSSVMSRVEFVKNPGDENVSVPANGFSLASTLTHPSKATGRSPAIVLVGEPTSQGRDEVVGGVPVFGQLAGALAGEGFVVARYDHRGTGQSGGRAEAATLDDYADDVRALVRYLRDRKDVDKDRVALIGYGEGGAIALAAAAKEKRVAAVVLISGVGSTGAEFVLEQQQLVLSRLQLSDAERTERIDLQKRIIAAVQSGQGWEEVPPELRAQADTPWFRSFLAFDPARVLSRADQPVLVVRPDLDDTVPSSEADRLLALAEARKTKAPADLLGLGGLNHQLVVPTAEGTQTVSSDAAKAIADWLRRVYGA
jgi:pimeloyl-ACP methyl ester carboxylesterase